MTNELYIKHKKAIENAINESIINYSISSAKAPSNLTVHCYYIEKNGISIVAYAKFDKSLKRTTGYSATVVVKSGESNDQIKDNGAFAKDLYMKLSTVHSEEIARTCLKTNFSNRAFKKSR